MADLDLNAYRSAAMSHAQALGLFGQVLDHEPLSAPGSGLTYALWVADASPIPQRSGLASVSVRLELTGRLFIPADTDPPGGVDVDLTGAVSAVLNAYAGDFDLNGTVAEVDILGQYGDRLRARFGYTTFPGSGTTYRVATVTLPLVINDVWTEAP